jgi:pyruvate kinase
MRKAKILATLGPASNTREVLTEMLQSGLNAVRINMSHGTQEEHAVTIKKRTRGCQPALDMPLSILVDLCGPKIRTRTLKDRAAGHSAGRPTVHSHDA